MDIRMLLEAVNLQSLAEEAGARFNNSRSSRCPLHNGNNPTAFHIYQGQDGIWRYHCFTNCPEGANGGDAVAFYMRWHNVDWKTAVLELGRRVGMQDDRARPAAKLDAVHMPIQIEQPDQPPPAVWQGRAAAFCDYAISTLLNEPGKAALDYLIIERGLSLTTITAFGLGYNPRDLFDDPGKWGQQNSRLWCPRGIVIPHKQPSGAIWFVNVRRPLPGDQMSTHVGQVAHLCHAKFVGLRGGKRGLFGYAAGRPVIVMAEGEFDTMLAYQAAGDLCDVVTLGGARHHIDARDAAVLARACYIVTILDDDEAGRKGAQYLSSVSPHRVIHVLPPANAHDLTDAWRAGVNLRRFIAGIVAARMEILLKQLDEHQQPDVFCNWIELYNKAIAAEAGNERL